MLISKTAFVKWNSKNKKFYVDKGYMYTFMGDEFEIDVHDLMDGSASLVTVKCDYCGKEYKVKWKRYLENKQNSNTDACGNVDCYEQKAFESQINKYGCHASSTNWVKAKRANTNIERYGFENVFASEYGKQKIIQTNMERYGVPYTQQNKDVRAKTVNTCRERYGVDNYIELFKGKFVGCNSPSWKGGVEHSRVERATHEYIQWRKSVWQRDNYTCQCCGNKSHSGHHVEIHAHHIKNWKDNPESRYDVDNGITLCVDCHTKFHSLYGKHDNTIEQINEFITLDKKIC